ncbi:PfkB family carbohydrate kinase [Pseudarthrobacter sp. MDT1-22]
MKDDHSPAGSQRRSKSADQIPRTRTFVSSGFTTVDIKLGDALSASPGGTATNVARVLQTMGWNTQLVGTIGSDPAGQFLKSALETDGVGVQHLRLESAWTTPVVLQEEHRGDHVWRFRCPICATSFAKHRPTPKDVASSLVDEVAAPDVFLFDRVSLFTLALADEWAHQGTFVVFEPSGLGRPHLFDRAIEAAHLVKFSSERAPAFKDRLVGTRAILVETLGANGAQVRFSEAKTWQHMPPQPITTKVDSAGAGDWTTAGLVDELFPASGVPAYACPEGVARAVTNGQVLGAMACSWEGVYPEPPAMFDPADFERLACPRVVRESAESAFFGPVTPMVTT